MSEHNTCLNCGAEVRTKFCGHCGQKASTHRVTMSHLIKHDFIHGAFHVDKGILYTTKQLFLRPGHAIREYLQGKRVNHFNAITFLLLVLAVHVFVQITVGFDLNEIFGNAKSKNFMEQFQEFTRKNTKMLYLTSIPASSLVSLVVFRKARLNYAEHLVINTYAQSMGVLIYTIFILFMPLASTVEGKRTLFGLSGFFSNIVYTVWLFWQFFRPYYKSRLSLTALLFLLVFTNMLMYTTLGVVLMLTFFKTA